MADIKPWVRGPFELLRHAEGHLKLGTDFDKRMALISFDNAIEVSIATYLQLHPKQRGDRNYRREQVAEWQTNYHAKLDFLYDHYLKAEGIEPAVTRDEVIWYHDLRNQLYHTGNGMVPEEQSLTGAREAATWVLSALFSVEAESLLTAEVAAPLPSAQQVSPQMRFLEAYIELERIMNSTLIQLGAIASGNPPPREARVLWDKIGEQAGDRISWMQLFDRVRDVRNRLVHGKVANLTDQELDMLTKELMLAAQRISVMYPGSTTSHAPGPSHQLGSDL